jgi:hypothetical protein
LSQKRNKKPVEKNQPMNKFFSMQEMLSTTQPSKQGVKNMNQCNIRSTFAALLAIIVGCPASWSQLAQPTAIGQVTIPGSRTEIFGMPFARGVVTAGKIASASVSSNSTTFTVTINAGESSVPSLSNTSTTVDERYVLEIMDGPAIGFLLTCTGNTGDTSITVEGGTGSISVPENTAFVIRKDQTLSSIFGAPSASHPFGSGASSIDPTVKVWVQLYNSVSGTLSSYYVYSSGATSQWRATSGPTDRTHVRIPQGRAVVLANRTSSDVIFVVSGESRSTRSRFSVPVGKLTFLANPSPLDSTFNDASIPETTPRRNTDYTAGAAIGDVTTSDQWRIWNPANRTFATYYIGTTTNGFPAVLKAPLGNEINPIIPAFKGVAVQPLGTNGNAVVTMAPKL